MPFVAKFRLGFARRALNHPENKEAVLDRGPRVGLDEVSGRLGCGEAVAFDLIGDQTRGRGSHVEVTMCPPWATGTPPTGLLATGIRLRSILAAPIFSV